MLPSDSTSARPARRGGASHYVISLVALVAIIGVIAWVVQYLPSIKRGTNPNGNKDKPLLAFMPKTAIWPKDNSAEKKDADPARKELDAYREFEQGKSGHYDFLVKNISGGDVEIVAYQSACDCASVQACVLSKEEHDRLAEAFARRPGEPLPYAKEPSWHDLTTDLAKKQYLTVKADEAGVIRVNWVARKAPGLSLNVTPKVFFQAAENPASRQFHVLNVPVMVRHAVQFEPARLRIGVFTASTGDVLTGEIDAWSSTREKLELKLTTLGSDPFFVIETRALSKQECADLEARLKASNIVTRVRSGAHATVKVYRDKDGKQLELGSFYRKLLVHLNDEPSRDIQGPEVVGRVEGDIVIGGANDQGRIVFQSFDRKDGGSKVVELTAPEDVELETATCEPTWVQVKLSAGAKIESAKRRIWRLEATVPPNTPTVRSFDEPDAVVLRIKGATGTRLVRIPIEGQVTER
jgi:hypothetical protein